MPALEIRTFETYDAFAEEWHAETLTDADVTLPDARERGLLNEQDTHQLWQLMGLLDEDEVIIKLPEWLAEEKVASSVRAIPTLFVGRIDRETEKAIRFDDAVAARPLMSLAHRIRALEAGLENTGDEADRRGWLERRLQEKQAAFESRDEMVGLQEAWLPKSQVSVAINRASIDRDS
jgi:hypothetical protein